MTTKIRLGDINPHCAEIVNGKSRYQQPESFPECRDSLKNYCNIGDNIISTSVCASNYNSSWSDDVMYNFCAKYIYDRLISINTDLIPYDTDLRNLTSLIEKFKNNVADKKMYLFEGFSADELKYYTSLNIKPPRECGCILSESNIMPRCFDQKCIDLFSYIPERMKNQSDNCMSDGCNFIVNAINVGGTVSVDNNLVEQNCGINLNVVNNATKLSDKLYSISSPIKNQKHALIFYWIILVIIVIAIIILIKKFVYDA